MFTAIGPGGAQESGGRGHERGAIDHGTDSEIHVVSFDQLSTHRPLRCRGPLRSGGCGGAVQRTEIGHLNPVLEPRNPPAPADLKPHRPPPFLTTPPHPTPA